MYFYLLVITYYFQPLKIYLNKYQGGLILANLLAFRYYMMWASKVFDTHIVQ